MPARHILIVDDDPDLMDLVRELLHGEGHMPTRSSGSPRARTIT